MTKNLEYRGLVNMGEFIPRALTQGLFYSDIMRTLEEIDSDASWCAEWRKTAEEHERLGREALQQGRNLTAGQALFRAALCYHFAQFLYFEDIPTKLATIAQSAQCYRDGMKFFLPPAQSVEIPFEGISLAGFFRRPSGASKSPCMILINGTDGAKLEFFALEAHFLNRGIATLCFDGPGQGETWAKMKLRADYEKATAAAVDFLSRHPAIDSGRIGVAGVSFGGHLSVRSACHDPRLRACIAVAGFYETSYYDWNDALRRIRFQYLCGTKDVSEAKKVAAGFDLSGRLRSLKAPLLVLHGRRDRTTPCSQGERIYAEAPGPKWMEIYEDGDHCCHNIPYKTHPLMADWASEMLRG